MKIFQADPEQSAQPSCSYSQNSSQLEAPNICKRRGRHLSEREDHLPRAKLGGADLAAARAPPAAADPSGARSSPCGGGPMAAAPQRTPEAGPARGARRGAAELRGGIKKRHGGKGEVAARRQGAGLSARGRAVRSRARAAAGCGNRERPGRRGGEERGCGRPVPWQDFPCRGRLERDRRHGTFPKGSGLRMRGGRPACREGALRLLLAAGPAGADCACAAAATRRLERAAAQRAWLTGQWDAAVRLRVRWEPVSSREGWGPCVCAVGIVGGIAVGVRVGGWSMGWLFVERLRRIALTLSAEWVEGHRCTFCSETFCAHGERSCGSSKGALRESRVRGSSLPALFLPCACLRERRGAAAEPRYCTCTARKEGGVRRRLCLLTPRWGSEKMVLYLLTRSLLRRVKRLFLRYG